MLTAAKISSKRQITVPLKVMIRLKLTPGDLLIFEDKDGRLEVKPRTEKFTIRDFVRKHRRTATRRVTDEEIRRSRQKAWSESDSK
jgi:AbrB family looped-hinge helix DNA binding protein